MLIRIATIDDIPTWLRLATEISPIFGVDDMAKTDSFKSFLKSTIEKMESIVAIDYISNELIGAIGFSKDYNSIVWLGVSKKYRKQGAGSRLLCTAINQLDTYRNIEVITFCQSDPNGLPARLLYEKFGFIQKEKDLVIDGHKRSKYILAPNYIKKGSKDFP